MHAKLTAVLVAVAVLPSAVQAQQPQQQPAAPQGIVVVSQQKCAFDKLNEANQFWRQNAGPILDDLVRQGRLTGWGVMEHMWGDEWNQVTYYTARDLNTFSAAFRDFFTQLMQRDANTTQRFAGWCSEHKDNIYNLVATNAVQSPR